MFQVPERRRTTKSVLQELIRQQQETIERLSRSDAFGCLTRAGLSEVFRSFDPNASGIPGRERLGAVYWDIDKLKDANTRWGKEESSRRIRESIDARLTDCVTGQVFSGDEFVAFPPIADCLPMAQRILYNLKQRDMSATFLVTQFRPGETPEELLRRLDAESDHYKNVLGRGTIYLVY